VFELSTAHPTPAEPRFAVWDLEDYAARRGRIHGRACDDLVGAAGVLATLQELRRAPGPVHALGVLSRAEEVGFRGALAVAATNSLPPDALVISLETSRQLPGVKMNEGVILRVGDRTSIFDSEAMRFLGEVAAGLRTKRPAFRFQRGLMSGGTCEATAYQEYGFQTAGVCIALGNYHNCAAGERIAAEYVSIRDACDMVELLTAVVRTMPAFSRLTGRLPARLSRMHRESRTRLRRTA
jgi:endoglucanase